MMNCPTLEQAPQRSSELLDIREEHADDRPMGAAPKQVGESTRGSSDAFL